MVWAKGLHVTPFVDGGKYLRDPPNLVISRVWVCKVMQGLPQPQLLGFALTQLSKAKTMGP